MKKKFILTFISSLLFFSIFNVTYATSVDYFYHYDKNNRLTSITTNGERVVELFYDKNGNLVKSSKVLHKTELNFMITNLTHEAVTITWDKEEGIENYLIEFQGEIFTQDVNVLNLTQLQSNKEYLLKVIPQSSLRKFEGIEFKFKTLLPPPTNLKAESIDKGVKLTWDKVVNADSYKIYRNSSRGIEFIASTPNNQFEISNSSLKNEYTEFFVTSFNGNESIPSQAIVYEIAHKIYIEYLSHDKVLLEWDKIYDELGYTVLFNGSLIKTNTNRIELNNLNPNQWYVVAVTGEEKLYAVTGEEKLYAVTGEEKLYAVTGEEKLYAVTGEEKLYAVTDEEKLCAVTGEEKLCAVTGEEKMIILKFKTLPPPPKELRITRHENGASLDWNAVEGSQYYIIYNLERFSSDYSISKTISKKIGETNNLSFEIDNIDNMLLEAGIEELYVTSFNENESVPSETVVYDPANRSKYVYEINDTKEQAIVLESGTYVAYIQDLGDIDYYEIRPRDKTVNWLMVSYSGSGPTNFTFQLFSESNGTLTELDIMNGGRIISYDSNKKYYIKVSGNNEFSEEFPYTLKIQFNKQDNLCRDCVILDPIEDIR